MHSGLHAIGEALAQLPGSETDGMIDAVKVFGTDVTDHDGFRSAIPGMA